LTIFDLLFMFVFFVSVTALGAVIIFTLRKRMMQAARLLALYGVCLAIYLAVIVAVSLASPQRVLAVGEDRCYDDWCIAVDDITRFESSVSTQYTVTLRLSNRARRVSQRENGMVVYMRGEEGRRFDSAAEPSDIPFNTLLQFGQAVTATRTFIVTGSSGDLVLVIEHEGSSRFPGMFIIGDDSSLFHKPMILHLP
jgi:hypothetical protein